MLKFDYDPTTGYILTPAGPGKYIGYDSNLQEVTVELEYMNLVAFNGNECYLLD